MIGVLLITHGTLGEALVQCVSHVMNRRPAQLMQLGISGQDDPLDALPIARRLVELVDSGSGVLILTDILGATPANTAAKLLEPGPINVDDRRCVFPEKTRVYGEIESLINHFKIVMEGPRVPAGAPSRLVRT